MVDFEFGDELRNTNMVNQNVVWVSTLRKRLMGSKGHHFFWKNIYLGSGPPSLLVANKGLVGDSLLKMWWHPRGDYYWVEGQPNKYHNWSSLQDTSEKFLQQFPEIHQFLTNKKYVKGEDFEGTLWNIPRSIGCAKTSALEKKVISPGNLIWQSKSSRQESPNPNQTNSENWSLNKDAENTRNC